MSFISKKMFMNAMGTVMTRMMVAAMRNRRMPTLAPSVSRLPWTRNGSRPLTHSSDERDVEGHEHRDERQDDLAREGLRRLQGRATTSAHLSMPPMIGSRLAMMAIVSATRWPGTSWPTAWSVKYDGSWMRNRNGWSEPSLMPYAPYWPRGLSNATQARPGGTRSRRGSLAITGPSGIWWSTWSMIRMLSRISSRWSR